MTHLHYRTGLFARFARRAFRHCFAELHETGRHRPETATRLYGAPAKEDFSILLRYTANHDLRVLVMDRAATLANKAFTSIARGLLAADGLAAVHAEFHYGVSTGLEVRPGQALVEMIEPVHLGPDGAGSENRTRTLFPEPDFESGASTSSAIPAERRQV